MPTTVVVGADRHDVAWLYRSLTAHLQCFSATRSVDYFSRHAARSVGWYRSHFPLSLRVAKRRGHVLEESPSYLASPSALRQMRQVLPKIRVVVLLSDPVMRAYKQYQHCLIRAEESRSFQACVSEELRANAFPPQLGLCLQPKSPAMPGCVAGGYYALQLELLLKLYPRNKVLILDSMNLHHDPTAMCERVFSFMGLESHEGQLPQQAHRGDVLASIEPRVLATLRAHYLPYDELLAEVIGQRFSWMVPPLSAAA
jgi:hypothetical protein